MSLDYCDSIYQLAEKLPETERFNLKSQITRAATSISLNIAEGSTGQTHPEQSRFLGMALRSLIETVACERLISRRNYVKDQKIMEQPDMHLHAFRRSLADPQKTIKEEQSVYDVYDP